MNNAIDDNVLPAIGLLLRIRQELDEQEGLGFSRRLGRLLAELTGPEFVSLQRIMHALATTTLQHKELGVMSRPLNGLHTNHPDVIDRISIVKQSHHEDRDEDHEGIKDAGHSYRLFPFSRRMECHGRPWAGTP